MPLYFGIYIQRGSSFINIPLLIVGEPVLPGTYSKPLVRMEDRAKEHVITLEILKTNWKVKNGKLESKAW